MKRLIVPLLIAALAFLCLMLLDESCRAKDDLTQERAAYAEFVRLTDADNALKAEDRAKQDATIAAQNDVIADSQAREAEKDALIVSQKATIKALKAAEPVQPELEQEPLVINLRAQIAAVTRAFDLSQNVVIEQKIQLTAWAAKYDAQAAISESWKRQYEDERALRLASENLVETYSRALKGAKFWRTAAVIAGAVALGAIITK